MVAVCVSGNNPRRVCAAAALALAGLVGPAYGIVSADYDDMDRPADGWIGKWNGSSAVPIAEHWFITAKHVGGTVNATIAIRGVTYRAAEIVQHPTYDLMLVRTVEAMPGWHELAETEMVEAGNPCILAGWGVTAGTQLSNGYQWNGARRETWGANTIDVAGFLLSINFSQPGSDQAVAHESTYAVNDSGGALFVHDGDGNLRLAGVAVSVSNWGSSLWGNSAYAVNVSQVRNWILPIVDPGRPVTSSVQAPPTAGMGWLVGAVVIPAALSGLMVRPRRRAG